MKTILVRDAGRCSPSGATVVIGLMGAGTPERLNVIEVASVNGHKTVQLLDG